MPLALSPSETFDVALDLDEAIPESVRPTFEFRYLSSRAYRARVALLDRVEAFYAQATPDQPTDVYEALTGDIYESLRHQLAGWKNLGRSFDRADLDDILNDAEARELLAKATRMSRLQVPEKNDSGSPSPGATGDAAPVDAPTTAEATTPNADSKTATDTSSSVPPAPGETPSAPSAKGPDSGS